MLDLLTIGQNLRCPHVATIYRYLLRIRARPQQQTRRCCCRSTGQTDGRTDIRPFYDAYRIGLLCGPRNEEGGWRIKAIIFHRYSRKFARIVAELLCLFRTK